MNPSYFETEFRLYRPVSSWPDQFAILSAFATTGEHWTHHESGRAERALEHCLKSMECWRVPLVCHAPSIERSEPAWACEMSFAEACIVGLTFQQEAVYYIQADDLYVSYCDNRRSQVKVGSFRAKAAAVQLTKQTVHEKTTLIQIQPLR